MAPPRIQCESAADQPVVHGRKKIVDRDDADRDHAGDGEHGVLAAEDAECAAVVGDVGEGEELGQPLAVAEFERLAQDDLGDLVEDDHQHRQGEESAMKALTLGRDRAWFERWFALEIG